MDSSGQTVIDTPEGIRMFHLLQLKYAMKLELETGLKHSQGNTFAYVRKRFGITARRKVTVYTTFCQMHNLEE